MPTKDKAWFAIYAAQDDVGDPATGDSANHTLRLVKDGTVATFISSPTIIEISATYFPGLYGVLVSAADNTGSNMILGGTSATSGVTLYPGQWDNDEAGLDDIYTGVQDLLSQFSLIVTFDDGDTPDERVLRLVRGDSYDGVLNAKKTFSITSATDLTTGTATLTTRDNAGNVLFSVNTTPVDAGGGVYTIAPTIAHADTTGLPVGRGVGIWDLQIVVGTSYATPILGTLQVDEDSTI